jgi:hypothetical protein
VHGGTAAAPMIGELLRELFKNDPSVKRDKEKTKKSEREEQQDEETPDTMDESD